jgi:hypothetical protein
MIVDGVDADHERRARLRMSGGLDKPDISASYSLRIASAIVRSQASRS